MAKPLVTTARIANTSFIRMSMNLAPVNALTRPLVAAIQAEFVAANARGSGIKGILVTSSLAKVFSAGLDLSELNLASANGKNTRETVDSYINGFQSLVKTMASSAVPTATIVHGACPAGGTVMALCTDYRVASSKQDAKFVMGLNESRVGLAPPAWLHSLARLNLSSQRTADRLVQLGYLCSSPEEALRYGFLDAVLKDATLEELETDAVEKLNELAAIPWGARSDCKLKARAELLDLLRNGGTSEMVDCIMGQEFQSVTDALLASLKKK